MNVECFYLSILTDIALFCYGLTYASSSYCHLNEKAAINKTCYPSTSFTSLVPQYMDIKLIEKKEFQLSKQRSFFY